MDFAAEEYARGVAEGRIVAPGVVRQACERHLRDLANGRERGLWFDATAAKVACAFFGVLRHWKGEWAGRPVALEPWQQFIVWNLFGWKREDGTRRFRTGYLEVPRKNGKTTLAAGLGLYLAFVDGEPGAEVYSAATKRDQARISHTDATQMVARSAQLRKLVKTVKDNLSSTATGSKFEPLGADADTLDGLNVHGALADEVHAWKGRELWDVLQTATGARRQPMMLAITTAGFDRQSLCYQLHDYTEKVNAGLVVDDSFFGMVYGLDPGDDWEDEATWWKANPNLGVSKKLSTMREDAAKAREMTAGLNAFLRLHLDVWTQAATRWIAPETWAACGEWPVDEGRLAGRRCYGGLDLSSIYDVTALALVFPPLRAGEPYEVVTRMWIPEDNLRERVKRDRAPYDAWLRAGWVRATPGNVIDYDFILADVEDLRKRYDIGEIAFDRWGATLVAQQLQEMGGDDWVVEFGQGFASMSPPMKELGKLIASRGLAHGNNPALAWMADNLVAREDPAGNIKPDKERSREKIDGMVALIMALDRATRGGGVRTSVYASRGLREL